MTDKRLRQAIGERVRAIREAGGLTQDEVGREARRLGLGWSRSAVAALERGDKSVSAEELVLLPLMLVTRDHETPGGSKAPTLTDLLPTGPEWVRLSARSRLRADALQKIARGQAVTVNLTEMDMPAYPGPAVAQHAASVGAGFKRLLREYALVWPGSTFGDLERAEADAKRDAEQGAARKAGVPARIVSAAAHATFGHGLTEERDLRAGDGATAQKRGRVTRQLLGEIEPRLAAYRKGRHGKH